MEACFHKYLCLYLYCAKHRQRDEAKRNRAGAAHAFGDSTDGEMMSTGMYNCLLLVYLSMELQRNRIISCKLYIF